jgi:hypothetical protein
VSRRRAAPPDFGLDTGSAQGMDSLTAGPLNEQNAIPLAIEDSMVSSLDVLTTREDAWDRFGIVRGFWDWEIIE